MYVHVPVEVRGHHLWKGLTLNSVGSLIGRLSDQQALGNLSVCLPFTGPQMQETTSPFMWALALCAFTVGTLPVEPSPQLDNLEFVGVHVSPR